jgi:hypothetical protein
MARKHSKFPGDFGQGLVKKSVKIPLFLPGFQPADLTSPIGKMETYILEHIKDVDHSLYSLLPDSRRSGRRGRWFKSSRPDSKSSKCGPFYEGLSFWCVPHVFHPG